MDLQDQHFGYLEWKPPEEMHTSCIQWLSEINFKEHIFFEDMLKEYTLPVLEAYLYEKARNLIWEFAVWTVQEPTLKIGF